MYGNVKYILRKEEDKICIYKQFVYKDEVMMEKKCVREYHNDDEEEAQEWADFLNDLEEKWVVGEDVKPCIYSRFHG